MDKQGPAVKHTPIKFSSCRGVAFEIKPSQVSPFALDAAGAAEQPPNDSNGGRWVWFPQPMNREHSSATLRSALSRGTSSHFCDLDDSDDEDADDDESVAADEIHDDEEMALATAAPDVSNVRSRSRRSLSSSAKPVRAAAAKGHSRLGVILLDQGLFTVYKRLFMLCVVLNAAGLAAAATGHFPYAKGHAALFAMGNILALTMCRSEAVLRAVFWLTVALLGRPWVPVAIKTGVTAILQSLGGIHSGCGVSSLAWLVYALVRAIKDSHVTPREIVGVSSAILALLALSCLAAFPLVRHLHHNVFERTHRFAGWTALALLWVFVVLSAGYDSSTRSYSGLTVASLVKRQELWLTAVITFLTILPWFAVRRVPVTVTAPSTHASIITFQGGVKAGLLGRISRSPLSEWHAFGIISDDRDTHSMLAGAVGDFTRGLVSDPPSHLWVRKVHFAGLPYLISMYRRVTMVATGSGICVFLSFLMQPSSAEVSLVWVAKGIDANYGEGMSAMVANSKILAGRVIVHDTATMGRPNVSELAVGAARRWNADAVIVTSNPEGSRDVVSGCKKAGIPAFGPIWDS
ncbi:adenylate-forming reductase 06235-like [Lolium perenne]|uniref:adenylate-forming reductase 06235-like n=1 Tax=Lolium perenne TaxID=4522 RepID=UPI0021EAA638|nr:adenylate-forming reductase 06235-like [Lolium perenne]